MDEKILAATVGAAVGGLFAAIGWFVLHHLTMRREVQFQRNKDTVIYLQRQIEELYGPVLGMLQNSTCLFDTAKKAFPTTPGGMIDVPNMNEEDSQAWNYMLENYFFPNNTKIAELIKSHLHLLDKGRLPPSYNQFAQHQVQFECLYSLWKELKVDKRFAQDLPWPPNFENEIETTLDKLRKEYTNYLKTATFL